MQIKENSAISFTSTYRVQFHQPRTGIKPSQKDALKALAIEHGGIVPSSRVGNVKFSCQRKFDEIVKATLQNLGFNTYESVCIHNVPKEQIPSALEAKGRFATVKNK